MRKIIKLVLNALCKAGSAVSLFMVCISTGTISTFGPYEPEVPDILNPANFESE